MSWRGSPRIGSRCPAGWSSAGSRQGPGPDATVPSGRREVTPHVQPHRARCHDAPTAGDLAPRLPVHAGPCAERDRGRLGGHPGGRLPGGSCSATRGAGLDQPGSAPELPPGADAPGYLREPVPRRLGWGHGQHPVLGAPDFRRAFPDFRDQLRPSGLPGPMVRPIAALHVSLPRGRVLRGRLSSVRPTAPGAVRVPVPGSRRATLGARRADPDAGGAGVTVMARLRSIGSWLEERTGLGAIVAVPMAHRVPRSTASWAYVFGSATLILFVLQIATGICLALVYVPSPDQAYESLEYLNYQAALGWYLRAVHFWGSNAMVLVMTLHMLQVFLWGAHKYPRELTWVAGVLLFLCTLGMAFTGQILRW